MSLWVVDTSSLIFLAHLDRLDLLRQEADEILVPPAVLQELRAKTFRCAIRHFPPPNLPAMLRLGTLDRYKICLRRVDSSPDRFCGLEEGFE